MSGSQTAGTLHSEQQLVDCDSKSSGCDGGLMEFAFEYLKSNSFCTESQYPYTGKDGSCQDPKCKGGPSNKDYTSIRSGDENGLLQALASGPVSVAVDATDWPSYKGGVISSCAQALNHGVTLVGYDGSGVVSIRNSWGPGWGEGGHIRLKTGNTCGYAIDASFPNF